MVGTPVLGMAPPVGREVGRLFLDPPPMHLPWHTAPYRAGRLVTAVCRTVNSRSQEILKHLDTKEFRIWESFQWAGRGGRRLGGVFWFSALSLYVSRYLTFSTRFQAVYTLP